MLGLNRLMMMKSSHNHMSKKEMQVESSHMDGGNK